jgi:AcrR family transcriptional regulator
MTRPANPKLPGRILDAAEKIVAASGHDALNMRRLADEAGITPTTLYYYFESKDHILSQIKLRAAKRLNGKLQRMDLADPAGALRELARAYIAFAEENPRLYRLFVERLPAPRLSDEEQRTLHFSYFAAERALAAVAGRGPSEPDARTKAMGKWILLHGFVSLLASGALETVVGSDRDELKKTFFDIYAGRAERSGRSRNSS